MPLPIICLDAELRHFAEEFRSELSKPQYQHFVTVLLGLMLCEGASTLLGLLRQVADGASESSLSRFLSKAPVVTGYLIGDDSTIHKRKGLEDGRVRPTPFE